MLYSVMQTFCVVGCLSFIQLIRVCCFDTSLVNLLRCLFSGFYGCDNFMNFVLCMERSGFGYIQLFFSITESQKRFRISRTRWERDRARAKKNTKKKVFCLTCLCMIVYFWSLKTGSTIQSKGKKSTPTPSKVWDYGVLVSERVWCIVLDGG